MFGKVTQKVIVVEPYLKAPEIDSGDVRKLTGCRRSIVSGLHSALDPGEVMTQQIKEVTLGGGMAGRR